MLELERLMNIYQKLGPTNQGKNLIEIRCYCDFEGHGRASETWEKHWELRLPLQQAYWKGTKGWNKCNDGVVQKFHGKEFKEVYERALEFARDMLQPSER